MLFSGLAFAQGTTEIKPQPTPQVQTGNLEVEMADKLRADGKIYVVVVVLLIILLVLFTYVILLDRKISKLEKEVITEKK
jgi:hypothetical protein